MGTRHGSFTPNFSLCMETDVGVCSSRHDSKNRKNIVCVTCFQSVKMCQVVIKIPCQSFQSLRKSSKLTVVEDVRLQEKTDE